MLENSKIIYTQDKKLLEKLPVFYQPWYMDIFGIEWGVVVQKNENYTLVFPYFIENKLGLKLSRPHNVTPYYGPFICSENNAKVQLSHTEWEHIKQLMPRWSMQWLTPHYALNSDYLLADNYTKIEKVTHILDLLKSEEVLWKEMDSMRRRNIRKADKELTIQENDFDVAVYLDWMRATYQKRNKTLYYEEKIIRKYFNEVMAHNAALAYTCYNIDGKAVAMTLCLFDNVSGYAILVAKNPEIHHSAASSALLWKSIIQCKNKGCTVFDFEGSSIPEIANFYSKFGSTRIEFGSYKKTNSLIWKIKESLT